MVEEEAHTVNLTQRVKVLLNVPESPQMEDTSVIRSQNNSQKGEELQSTIQEVEEELEEVKRDEKL